MNNSKKHLALLSVLLCLLLIAFSGCTPVEHLQSDYQIVTSFYPMYLFTRNLTEGISGVTVVNMTAQNAGCLHDYQLLSKDMKALGAADAFVINGAGMEGFLEKVIEQLPSLPVITASEGIEILCENAEHEHEEEQAHGHAGHEHEENAHVWLSVPNAIAEVNNIAAGLKKLLPGNEAQIERNRSAYEKRLLSLDAELAQMLAPIRGAEIISFHEAYDYFAQRYGLVIAGAIETHDGGEPGTKELIETVERIRSHGIRAIFIEPNYQGSSAGILSRETGAKLCTLNPVTQGEDSLTAYEGIMRQNAKTIVEAEKNGD